MRAEPLVARPRGARRPRSTPMRALGVKVVLVSNSEGMLEALFARLGIAQYFDLVVDSGKVGVEKPDPASGRLRSTAYPTPPDRVLHLGDTYATDIAGAQALGFRAGLIDPYGHYAGRHLGRACACPASSKSRTRSSEVRPVFRPCLDLAQGGAYPAAACGIVISVGRVGAVGVCIVVGARRVRGLLAPRARDRNSDADVGHRRPLSRSRLRRRQRRRAVPSPRRGRADRAPRRGFASRSWAPPIARSGYDAGLVVEMTNTSNEPIALDVDDSCGTFEAQASNASTNSFEIGLLRHVRERPGAARPAGDARARGASSGRR